MFLYSDVSGESVLRKVNKCRLHALPHMKCFIPAFLLPAFSQVNQLKCKIFTPFPRFSDNKAVHFLFQLVTIAVC